MNHCACGEVTTAGVCPHSGGLLNINPDPTGPTVRVLCFVCEYVDGRYGPYHSGPLVGLPDAGCRCVCHQKPATAGLTAGAVLTREQWAWSAERVRAGRLSELQSLSQHDRALRAALERVRAALRPWIRPDFMLDSANDDAEKVRVERVVSFGSLRSDRAALADEGGNE